ncbi:MAG: DUF4143 domain-containing protein [Propionibacteriaceae bacterium]|nr:DUF4143 domain-containing protein [Propionibacteriaceae bacterium]
MDTAAALGRKYQPRVIDATLVDALASAGAVVIEGARATGKTMTALNVAQSYVFLDDPEVGRFLDASPRSVLEGAAPRLLDEWQIAPEVWNLVRRSVDRSSEPGRFILTGSAVPADDVTRHSGAGRFIRIRQRTMTWWEKQDDTLSPVSLAALFSGERPMSDIDHMPDLESVISRVMLSGFPALTNFTDQKAANRLRAYADEIARVDIPRLADVRHQPEVIRQLIVSLARSVASEVTFTTLAADLRPIAPSIDVKTVGAYVELLQRLFVVEAQWPWAPALRSRARVRTSPKYHLVDPSFAAAVLRATPDRLRNDLTTLGALFESAVVHDLSVFADALGGEVRHYRDSNNKEIDAVVTLADGRWGAVEVKLGGRRFADGVTSLNRVIDQIDTYRVGDPAFRLVVTGTGPTLVTDDGVITAPLAALAP